MKRVVAGTEGRDVVAAVAVDGVVAVAADAAALAPEPPARLSAPAPPSIVVGSVSEGAVAFVDADEVVAVTGIERDSCDVLAGEVVVRRAVVADVELENAGVAGLQAKREPVTPLRALNREQSVLELRMPDGHHLGSRSISLPGHNSRRGGESGRHGHCRKPQPADLHRSYVRANHVLHGSSFPMS